MNSNVKSLLIAGLVGGAAYLGSEQLKQVKWMQEHPQAWYVEGAGLAALGYFLRKKNMAAAMALFSAGAVFLVQGYRGQSGASSPSSPSSPGMPAPAPSPALPQGNANPGPFPPLGSLENPNPAPIPAGAGGQGGGINDALQDVVALGQKLNDLFPSQGSGLQEQPVEQAGALLRRPRATGAALTAMRLGRRY